MRYGFLILGILLLLVGCSSAQELNGTWRAGGAMAPSRPGEPSFNWFKEYEFSGHGYRVDGYPPLTEVGSFKVVSKKDSVWQVRLYNRTFQGEPDSDDTVEIRWADDRQSFELHGQRYSAAKDSKP